MIVKNSTRALVALALLFSVSFFLPYRTQACGPFFTDAIFVYTRHPDFPLEKFAAGNLGVLQPSYARSYLVAAYRNLAGNSLSDAEAKAIKSLWDDRLGYAGETNDEEWVKNWVEARKKVPGVAASPEIRAYRLREKPHEYESYLNCQQDAFDTAIATLNDRIKSLGADSAAIREWVTAQDAVFSNCRSGRQIPAEAQTADRAYQIAAANFYSEGFDAAAKQFDAIAHDKTSPWREKAAYLAARSLLRKGSLADKAEEGRPALADAEARLNSILKDKSLASLHHASARLLNLTRLRLHPEEKLHELAHTIIKKDTSADFKQDVWDYTVLLDKFLNEEEETTKLKPTATFKSDELTDWVTNFEDESAAASAHALQRWEQTKALPWLVAAIAKSDGQKADALLTAAAAVDHASPAFPSLVFHSARLLLAAGRADEARAMLDRTLTDDRARLSASALNHLLGQRMTLAANLDEFLKAAQRRPAAFSDNNDDREVPDDESQRGETSKGFEFFFAADSAGIFNEAMPVTMLRDSARSSNLAPNLRFDVAQASFVRAALLDERVTATQAEATLATLRPELRPFLTSYVQAATPDARRFAAAFLSLKYPGLRPYVSAGIGRSTPLNEIDSYRDNYWCAEPPVSLSGPPSTGEDGENKTPKKAAPLPAFLKSSQGLAASQFAALKALGTAPNYFCRIAIDWAKKNPTDPRAPEALHLAVRSTRYGCTDKETGRWSKAAYDLLHLRYPNTVWAKNTKYWFKD
jgi:hypothetical protein